MKYLIVSIFILIPLLMSAQVQATFLYEITLYEQFKHRSMWTEREHQIHQAHIAYLDSLAQNASLEMAGIIDQGLEDHTGIILLKTSSYAEAQAIATQDPSVRNGMMRVRLRPIHIYFRGEE